MIYEYNHFVLIYIDLIWFSILIFNFDSLKKNLHVGLVKFLATDPAGSYMTGHCFNIDGGMAIGAT